MDSRDLDGISFSDVLPLILDAIDKGINTDEIRKNPMKYLTSGKTKEIVINSGGEGLIVNPEIISEMAKRGDKLAQKIIDKKQFRNYQTFSLDKKIEFAYLEKDKEEGDYSEDIDYDRENKILIKIIKEKKMRNNGGMGLVIYEVYEEDWSYKVLNTNDHWRSEYVSGWSKIIGGIKG